MKTVLDSFVETYKYLKNKKILAGYPMRDDIARGKVGGARQAQIEGYTVGVTANQTKDVSELGVNVIPTPSLSGVTMNVQSTSNSDNFTVGTGAMKVIVEYIEPVTEQLKSVEVEMNGTAAVAIPVSIAFVSDFYVSQVSNLNDVAIGDITLTNNGTTYAIIKAGGNKSLQCYRYVPKGKNLYISSMDISSSTKAVTVRLRATQTDNLTKLNNAFIFRAVAVMADAPTELTFDPPIVFTGGVYIKTSIYSTTNDNAASISVGLSGWLEDKESGTLNN